jgi:hypothetical protein
MRYQVEEVVWPPPPLEHLLPEESPFFAIPGIAQHHQNVSTILLRSQERNPTAVASVVCLPSFSPQWALRLIGTDKDGFQLLLNEAASPIWYSADPASVGVEDRMVAIDQELSGAIREVWRRMLSRVQHSKHARAGLDGVKYHFSFMSLARGPMAGKIWSPEEETAPGRLVSLSHVLCDFVRASPTERESVLVKVRELIGWFEELPEDRR